MLSWIWRSYLRTALVPLLVIELALVAAYLLTNDTIREKNSAALRVMAEERLQSAAHSHAEVTGQQLNGIARSTRLFAWTVRRVLASGAPLAESDVAERLANFRQSPGGAHHSAYDDGRFAAFYSNVTEVGPAERARLARLYEVDPLMRELLARHDDVVQVYFNSHDSLNIIRPYFDVISQYPQGLDIPTFNFYYLADVAHNPTREPVWTDVYVDPAGQGWMTSCIAPVYRDDVLEGVVGLDVTVKQIVRRIEDMAVPWQGYGLLLDRSGTIMAMPASAEHDWGVTELTDHHYAAAIERDIFKPEAFNVLKREDSRAWAGEVMARADGYRAVEFAGDKVIAWSTIPQTGWKLLIMVPEANIFARVDALRDQVRDLGLLMLVGLGVFYLFFLAFLFYRARRMSGFLARPLLGISNMTDAIARGRFDQRPEAVGLREIDATAASVARLGRELGAELEARRTAEANLAEMNVTLEKRVRQRTQDLEEEVARRQHLEDELRRMADYDPLTKLPNRRLFEDRLQQAAMLAERTGKPLAVLFIDLDRFKEVNDACGHEAGDELLAEVAERLRDCVRSSDTVARFGGDEFCALLLEVGDRASVETVARKMLARMAAPFRLAKGDAHISASIGIVRYPQAERKWEHLLHEADTAMYRVKRAGRGDLAWVLEDE